MQSTHSGCRPLCRRMSQHVISAHMFTRSTPAPGGSHRTTPPASHASYVSCFIQYHHTSLSAASLRQSPMVDRRHGYCDCGIRQIHRSVHQIHSHPHRNSLSCLTMPFASSNHTRLVPFHSTTPGWYLCNFRRRFDGSDARNLKWSVQRAHTTFVVGKHS